jgi:hypothetical protein
VRYTRAVFLIETSREHGVGALLLGSPVAEADWGEYVRAIGDLNRGLRPPGRPVLAQLIRIADMPSATVRREIAELRKRVRPDVVNVVISQEPIVRYAQIALGWLHPPHYDSTVHATPGSAFAHVERALNAAAGDARVAALRRLVAALERRAPR